MLSLALTSNAVRKHYRCLCCTEYTPLRDVVFCSLSCCSIAAFFLLPTQCELFRRWEYGMLIFVSVHNLVQRFVVLGWQFIIVTIVR